MPIIDHLPRPWLLAAMTGMPVSALVGAERPETEDQAATVRRARPPRVRIIPDRDDPYRPRPPATH